MKTRPAESGSTAANSAGVPEENFCMKSDASASGVSAPSGVVAWAVALELLPAARTNAASRSETRRIIVTSRLREVRIGGHFANGDRETRARSKGALRRLVERRARGADERRRRRIADPIAEMLCLEPELARALVHQLGEDRRRASVGERRLPVRCTSRCNQRERCRGIAGLELRFGRDVTRPEARCDSNRHGVPGELELLIV